MFQSRTLWHGWKYLYLVSMRLGDIIDICPVFCLLEFQKRIHSEFWRSFWEGKCFFFQLFAWQNRINSKRNELRMRQGLGLACWLLVLVIIGVIKWKHGLIFVFPLFFFSIVDMVFFFFFWLDLCLDCCTKHIVRQLVDFVAFNKLMRENSLGRVWDVLRYSVLSPCFRNSTSFNRPVKRRC